MRVVTTLSVAAVLSVSAIAAAAGPVLDRIRDTGFLVGATDPAWPPYSWREPIGEYAGFDVEVTREIAARLGARAEFVTPPWEEQVAGDWGERWDIAVTEMTPTAERSQRLVFPAIYNYGVAVLAVRADDASIPTVAAAAGRKIAVIEDTVFETYLRGEDLGVAGAPPVRARIEAPEIVAYAVSGPNYLALSEGRVDALVDDWIAIEGQLSRGRALRIVGDLFAAPAAVAVATGDPEFAAEIARIVEEMRSDGSLRDLAVRWFGFDSSRPPDAALAAVN